MKGPSSPEKERRYSRTLMMSEDEQEYVGKDYTLILPGGCFWELFVFYQNAGFVENKQRNAPRKKNNLNLKSGCWLWYI